MGRTRLADADWDLSTGRQGKESGVRSTDPFRPTDTEGPTVHTAVSSLTESRVVSPHQSRAPGTAVVLTVEGGWSTDGQVERGKGGSTSLPLSPPENRVDKGVPRRTIVRPSHVYPERTRGGIHYRIYGPVPVIRRHDLFPGTTDYRPHLVLRGPPGVVVKVQG